MANRLEGDRTAHRTWMVEKACWLTSAVPEELPRVLGLALYNFLVITAYLIVKPVRNSLFLDRLGSENLPYAYIGTALFVGGVVWAYSRLLDRLPRTRVLGITWNLLGAGLVAFWFGFRLGGVEVSALFYFFTAAFAVVGVTQFWSFAAEVLDARQGRRLFSFVQAGGIAGGFAGSLLTQQLASVLGTEQLLLISAVICFLCGALAAAQSQAWPVGGVPGDQQQERAEEDSRAMAAAGGFDLVRRSRYLLLICLMLLCFQMVSTLIDFQFQHVMEQGFALKDERTAFYGTFTLVLNLASLGFQIFFTSWIHRNHGLGPSLILLPLAGILGGFGFFLFPVFWMGCGLRWAFGTLDYSLDRATRELLYLPTSREVKYKAKAFIDMFCFRFFRSLAGIVILIVQSFKGLAIQNLSLAVMFFCGVWLVVARWTRRENLRQLRQTLLGSLEPAVPVPDVGIEKLAETLLEIGFELQRLQETLALPGQGAKTLGEKSIQRLLELAGQLFGPSDVAGAVRALDGPEASRALALELLDGIGDVRIGLPLFRVLDPQRAPGEKPALVSLLLKRIGTLPRRPEEREVWTAAPPRKPRDEKSEMD